MFIAVCVLLVFRKTTAQNLVPNSSFEVYSNCPLTVGELNAASWEAIDNSPDYFNTCSDPTSSVGVPNNTFGYESPHSGNAYAGIITGVKVNPYPGPYTESIGIQLSSSLIAGREYRFEMFVSLADLVGYASAIEAYFSSGPSSGTHGAHISMLVTNKVGWTLVSGRYIARGGENFLTIGNFQTPVSLVPLVAPPFGLYSYAYYYIDDVRLEECTPVRFNIASLPDTVYFCKNMDSIVLTAVRPGFRYLWNTGNTTSSITVPARQGTYSVLLRTANSDQGCPFVDSVIVLPAPVNNFTLGPHKTLCKGATVTINAPPVAQSFLMWNTGSTAPSLSTDTAGSYWLEMIHSSGCKARDSINVNHALVNLLNLGNDRYACEGSYLILDATMPGDIAYSWSNHRTESSIVVTQPGTYSVIIEDNSSCKAYDTVSVAFSPKPVISLGADTIICGTGPLLLNAQNPGATYLWNTRDTAQSITISRAGKYMVRVEKQGCASADSITVKFEQQPVVSLCNDTILCQGQSIRLSATFPGASYTWNTGSTDSVVVTVGSGKYSVEVTKASCKARDSVNVYHQLKPQLDLGPDTAICSNQAIVLQAPPADHYLWQDGSSSSSMVVSTSGLYWVRMVQKVCTVSDSILITGKPAPAVFLGKDTTLCRENSLTLDAGNAGSAYRWNNQSTAQSIQVYAPGLFSVIVVNSQGCTATDSVVLDTFVSPIVQLGADSFVCEGSSLLLNAGHGFDEYLWQDGSVQSRYEATGAGVYSVRVKDQHRCIAWDSILLTDKPRPSIELQQEIRVCDPDFELTLPGSYAAYQWQDGTTSPGYKVNAYGRYTVTVTDASYCTNTASVEISNNCPGTVYIPNAFTPLNNDGINDIFYPVIRNVKSLQFQVYNRWGQLLFETNDLNNGWNGIHRNEYSISDVYIYKVIYTGMDDHTKMVSGDFTLLK